jgi:hypothetical protein
MTFVKDRVGIHNPKSAVDMVIVYKFHAQIEKATALSDMFWAELQNNYIASTIAQDICE